MSRFALTVGSLALATFFSAPALAQAVPGLGAGVNVGIPGVQVGGQISVGMPQVVVPASPSYTPPQPTVVYNEPHRRARYVRHREPNWGAPKVGIDLRINGAASFGANRYGYAYGMGGAGIGLRYRAMPHLGFEAGIDLLGGRDYNDNKRFEIAGTAGALVFFNPRSRAQLYMSGGLLLDHARASDSRSFALYNAATTYNHVGGYAGLGLEIFLTRKLAIHLDGRGVVRQKIGGSSPLPEFTDPATGRTTNTSGGFVGSAGLALYF